MAYVTPAVVDELMADHRRALSRAEAYQRKENTIKSLAYQLGEGTASAVAFGVLRGVGKGEVKSVPVDLCIGAVLVGCAFAFSSRKASPHLANIGCGAMASFGVQMGAMLAARIAADKPQMATSGEAGLPPMLGMGNPFPTRGPLSDRELMSLVQSTAPRPIPVTP